MARLLQLNRQALLVAILVATTGCATHRAAEASPDTQGQLITREMIGDSELSTAWEVLRRFANHLSFAEHPRTGPTRMTRRGQDSINLPDEPLVVIDGVAVRDFRTLASLAANDVESMRILTGAQGSTRYGLRAASGVILVRTTGRGSPSS